MPSAKKPPAKKRSPNKPPQKEAKPEGRGVLILAVILLASLGAFQINKTGDISQWLIGGVVVIGLASAGYISDRILERVLDRWGGGKQ